MELIDRVPYHFGGVLKAPRVQENDLVVLRLQDEGKRLQEPQTAARLQVELSGGSCIVGGKK